MQEESGQRFEENKSIVDAFDKRITAIGHPQEQFEHRIVHLELKLGRIPGDQNVRTATSAPFKADYVEVNERFLLVDRASVGGGCSRRCGRPYETAGTCASRRSQAVCPSFPPWWSP